MKNKPVSVEISMLQANTLLLNNAKGTLVHCRDGVVWITLANEPTDIFLRGGENYLIDRNGLTLIEMIGDEGCIALENQRLIERLKKWAGPLRWRPKT